MASNLTAELQALLQHRVLPLLSVHALARLSCTCLTLHKLSHADHELWKSLAAAWIPPAAPLLSAADIATVKRILAAHSAAARSIRQNSAAVVSVPPEALQIAMSPDGKRHALVVLRDTSPEP